MSLDAGDGWTAPNETHDMVMTMTNTSGHWVRFHFDEGCGEHESWTVANFSSDGKSVDVVNWDGCPTLMITGAPKCEPDGYDAEPPPGATLRRGLSFFPTRAAMAKRCNQTLEPLAPGAYEVHATTPIALEGGGWLTAKTTMQVR